MAPPGHKEYIAEIISGGIRHQEILLPPFIVKERSTNLKVTVAGRFQLLYKAKVVIIQVNTHLFCCCDAGRYIYICSFFFIFPTIPFFNPPTGCIYGWMLYINLLTPPPIQERSDVVRRNVDYKRQIIVLSKDSNLKPLI